ncbi:MAG: tRNA-dihydrouridine synthase family protein [Anaerolineaceae bacterium]|nr:tRNA-dihydrouridine synthase family protein [Anaerolineaceae bacterium]
MDTKLTGSHASSNVTFYIGKIPIIGNAILAPMDGITDSPFRQLCKKMGSAASVSEFVNALNLINGHPHIEEQLPFSESERPFAYQIFDNNVSRIVDTAKYLMKYKPDFIDINMGCSNRSVANRGAGAGLMRDHKKVELLFKTITNTLTVPVTAKIRLGWDVNELNFLEIAHILEDNGCSCISLHARTRVQQYGGKADWDSIASLVDAVTIPVIGNGDIQHSNQITELISYTGCNAVMIGRAAIGNPWIFQKEKQEQISNQDRYLTMKDHLDLMVEYYEHRGIILFRKHLKKYLSIPDISKESIQKAFTFTNPDQLAQYLQGILHC